MPWKKESFSGQYEELFSLELNIAKFLVADEIICSDGLNVRLEIINYEEGYYCEISFLVYSDVICYGSNCCDGDFTASSD